MRACVRVYVRACVRVCVRTGVAPQFEIGTKKSNGQVTLNTVSLCVAELRQALDYIRANFHIKMLGTQKGRVSMLPVGKQWLDQRYCSKSP